ncbi:MAG: hypothetical protein H7A03_09115, partial [Pseudomonadales bacterium]|nr:hypothetical protein [Pseudomonadales bacterium]
MDQQNTPLSRQTPYSDEIDLFELWYILVKKKWLIFVVTLLFTIASIVVAYSIKPVYKATVHFLPVAEQDVQRLQAAAQELDPVGQDSATLFLGRNGGLRFVPGYSRVDY